MSLFLNATLGGCLLRHAGHPWGTFVWENPPDFGSVGLGRYCCCCCGIHWYIGRTVFEVWGIVLELLSE